MGDEAGIAMGGIPPCRGSEGGCIGVVNRRSISPGPASLGGKFVFWGNVAHPNPDVRRRRVVITNVRRPFVMRRIPFKFNDQAWDGDIVVRNKCIRYPYPNTAMNTRGNRGPFRTRSSLLPAESRFYIKLMWIDRSPGPGAPLYSNLFRERSAK